MDEEYKNDPRYKQLISYAADTGDIFPLQEYFDAQGINQPPYKYKTLEEYAKETGDIVPLQDYMDDNDTQGMQLSIPDEYAQDYLKEYNKINENYDPLLMYILQKNAQSGFKYGPIGTDSYYETFDPEINEDLREDFNSFMNDYYPDFDNKYQSAYDNAVTKLGYDYIPNIDYLGEEDFSNPAFDEFDRLDRINYLRDNPIKPAYEVYIPQEDYEFVDDVYNEDIPESLDPYDDNDSIGGIPSFSAKTEAINRQNIEQNALIQQMLRKGKELSTPIDFNNLKQYLPIR